VIAARDRAETFGKYRENAPENASSFHSA